MRTRITLFAMLVTLALAVPAAPATALSLTIGTNATLAPFQPGQTATGSGTITVAAPLGSWTLKVQDSAGGGFMARAATGCAGSDAQLTNRLSVTVTGSGVTSAGSKLIGTTATQVANGPLTVATILTTAYAQIIPASQIMLTGCGYTLTATYTLQ